MIADVTGDQRVQRRGRIVIVTIIVLFLLACAVLGVFLWQRQQEEQRLGELTAPGLLSVGVPPLAQDIDALAPLENNRGLVATYRDADGEPLTQFRLLNIRVGPGLDLCAALGEVEPELAGNCESTAHDLSAHADGPSTILLAEGQLRAATLVVLVAHPANYDAETLRSSVEQAEWMSVRDLADQVG